MSLWLAVSMTTALAVAPASPSPVPVPEASSSRTRARTGRKVPDSQLSADSAKGFVVAGAVLTSLSTWSTGMVASRYLDSRDATKQGMGRVLPIPFVGPIVAAAKTNGVRRYISALGLIQGAGLSFLTIGAISMSRHRRRGHPTDVRNPNKATGVLALTQGVMWLSVTWGMTFGFSRARAQEGDAFSRRLQVPLIGGIWAAPLAPNYTRGYLGLTSNAIQIVSASAIVFGAVVLGRRRARSRLSVMPVPTAEGAQLVAAMRF